MAGIQDIKTKIIYVSVSANRHENNISFFKNHLLYSRSNCLILKNSSNSFEAPTILAGHEGEINGQRFVSFIGDDQDRDDCCYIISTSYDKSAIIWAVSKIAPQQSIEYEILFKFKSPSDSEFITRSSLRSKDNGKFISITTSLDNSIHLWHNDQLIETLKTPYCSIEAKLFSIHSEDDREKDFILAFLAGSDNIIHIFQVLDNKLRHVLNLSGHSDWTKCIEILNLPNRKNEFLVASASQDSYIRVWHIRMVNYEINSNQMRTLISEPLLSSINNESTKYNLISTLETVLSGHEGIVTSLSWFKKQQETNLQLISCSSDKTIVLWQSQLTQRLPENSNSCDNTNNSVSVGIWKELERFGETGETNLPFLGVCLSRDEKTFFAHSLRGAIHSWSNDNENKRWNSGKTITGHFEPVTDLCWEENGSYLLSVSLDKTCRIHTRIDNLNNKGDYQNWIELARPQVHGHEINCIASMGFTNFATGAEEKTIRVYEATQFFIDNYTSLAKKNDGIEEKVKSISKSDFPKHAQLPALGLSIKASQAPYDIESIEEAKKGDANNSFIGATKLIEELSKIDYLTTPPTEEILLQSTLWWERNKLFGHGNELHALAYASRVSFLASASKANRIDLANILIWDAKKMRKIGSIEHHSLTITRLRFSPSTNEYLLSVSRDRTWCLSKRNRSSARSSYSKLVGTGKANAIHDRIIWDCAWTWDEKYFITVSRDKKAIIWSTEKVQEANENQSIKCVSTNLFHSSIQAVDCPMYNDEQSQSSTFKPPNYLMALAFEDGDVSLICVRLSTNEDPLWQVLKTFSKLHHQPIRRLAFKPPAQDENLILASAADDCMIKLTEIIITHSNKN